MRRLIVNPGTDSAWEIPLKTGIATLGRNADNDVVINHPSIAGNHCQLLVMDETITLKDLTAGAVTLVNGQPVEEVQLIHGHAVQLGEVLLHYEAVESPPPVPPAATFSKALCKFHPRTPARFLCPTCQGTFCEACVSTRFINDQARIFCRTCATECTPLATAPLIDPHAVEATFAAQIRGAFKYPLHSDGIILLVAGTIMLVLVQAAMYIAKFSPTRGLSALIILFVFSIGYLGSYLQSIITSTAAGEDKLPDWPEISDFYNDVVIPFFQCIGIIFASFAPAIALFIYAVTLTDTSENSWLGWASLALMLLGSIYIPMAFMAVAMYGTIFAINPLLIIPSIVKVLREYTLTVVLLFVVFLARWICHAFLMKIPHMFIPAWIIYSFIGLYIMTVNARILGLLYRVKKYDLGWFH